MSDVQTGRTINTHDEATQGSVTAIGTSITVIAANPERIYFSINNGAASESCWVKLQAASVDNVKEGEFLAEKGEGRTFWEMPPDNIYTGEISVIRENSNVIVFFTEY